MNAKDVSGQGWVAIDSEGDWGSHELWQLCLTSLHAENHTIIRRDAERRLYEVVPIKDAAGMVAPQDALETTGTMPGYQSVVVPLKNIRAVRLIDRVESLLALDSKLRIEPIEGENSVLASGTLERLEDAIGLIRQIDEDKAPPAMYTIELRNRTASEVVPDVKSIIEALDKQGWLSVQSSLAPSPDGLHVRVFGPPSERERVESLIRESDQQAPIETRVLDTRGYPLDSVASYVTSMAKDDSSRGSGNAWEVDQDELTGALIITGTPAELDAAEAALDRLGDLPAESKRIVSMIEVHHREASKLRGTVAQLLAARVLGEQGDGEPVQGRLSPGSDPALQQLSATEDGRSGEMSGLELAVDEEMNVIIATGTPRRIEQVKGLVEQLDVRQPQVQLEVVLLSLSESQTQDLGVELSGNIDTGKTLVGLGSLFGISSISPSSTSAQASGAGGSAVVLSPGDFSAVIRAIQTVNSGRSASMPSIVVNNNETATLNSTTTQPYLTTTITDSGTTTARGGSASAGTTITVSPQIAAGDHIVLDYSFTLSSFVGEASADGVEPPSQQTSLNSIATIPDGYTIVLGGIESTTEGDSNTKTPGLADIPLLGELFKSRSDSTSRSRFYVFIRATVMRSPSFEYLKYISEEMAESVQVEDGWPEVEPRFIR
ncbi:MAG: secretin N-terminal domain-containing protein [Phycisphaerales bacterium]